MSATVNTSWNLLLGKKRAAFLEQHYALPPGITSEDSFRSEFEELCRRHREGYCTRLYASLKLGCIDAFTSAVDAAYDIAGPETLTSQLWGSMIFRELMRGKCGIEADIPFANAAKLLGDLNVVVPPLGADFQRFPNSQKLQDILQGIFSTYMDSLLYMASNFECRPGAPDIHVRLALIIEESKRKIEEGAQAFSRSLEEAKIQIPIYTPSGSGSVQSQVETDASSTHMKYSWQKRLGSGSFGVVDEVMEFTTRNMFARKNISFLGASAARRKRVKEEVRIMQTLCHQHIANISCCVMADDHCEIIMQPAGDFDLSGYLEKCTESRYQQDELDCIPPWFGCLLDALAFAHRKNVLHRDIKPSNILIKDRQVYLADFGLAKDFTHHGNSQSSYLCGTPVYRAPEVRQDKPRAFKADVFSLGCVFSEMLTISGKKSLKDFGNFRQCHEEDSFAFRLNLPKVRDWVNQLQDESTMDEPASLTLNMLSQDANKRKTASEGVGTLWMYREALFCQSHY